ncbi:hypothetical protein ABIF50_001412 [Bradyrhizobium diazoefficiens]
MLERIDKHRDEDAGLSGILPLRRGDVQPRVRNHGALRLLAVPAEARADGEGARECAHTRAGSYERTLQTKAGDVNLKVPKLRRQTFETAIIERYRRRESSVEEALIEMYLAGISVRRVEDITEALRGTRVSPSTVSNLNKKIYTKIEAWRNRRIEGEHPYLYLDGIVMKRSWAGEVRNVSLLVASAVNAEGFREILGICEGAKEDKSGWSSFLRHLVDRGLRGVQLVVSDACRGLVESVADYLPEARYQRCMVHFYRNVFSHVPSDPGPRGEPHAQGHSCPGEPRRGRRESQDRQAARISCRPTNGIRTARGIFSARAAASTRFIASARRRIISASTCSVSRITIPPRSRCGRPKALACPSSIPTRGDNGPGHAKPAKADNS